MKYTLSALVFTLSLFVSNYSVLVGQDFDLGLEVGINVDGPEYLWGGTATKEQDIAGQNILLGFGLDCYIVDNARSLLTDLTASYQFPAKGSIKPYFGGGIFLTRWSYKNDYEIDDFDTVNEKAISKRAVSSTAEVQILESSAITNSGLLAKVGATFRPRSRFIPFAEALFLLDGSQLVIKSGFRIKFGDES